MDPTPGPSPDSLGLFPLQTVLMPGGELGLRVFEARYLDLVRECGRTGSGFGVCLVLEGDGPGAPAIPAAFGTEALIEDFGTGDDGLLTLRVRGARRFHVRRTRVRDNGLLVGNVEWRALEPPHPLQPQHALLGTLLRRILEKAGDTPHEDAAFDDACWIAWRLAEILPLADAQRQTLLQEDDADVRLDRLLSMIA